MEYWELCVLPIQPWFISKTIRFLLPPLYSKDFYFEIYLMGLEKILNESWSDHSFP